MIYKLLFLLLLFFSFGQDSFAQEKQWMPQLMAISEIAELSDRNIAYEKLKEDVVDSLFILKILIEQGRDNVYNGNVILAKGIFERILLNSSYVFEENDRIHYFLGYCYYFFYENDKAINCFNSVRNMYKDPAYKVDALSFLIEIALRVGEYDLASEFISYLPNSKEYFVVKNKHKARLFRKIGKYRLALKILDELSANEKDLSSIGDFFIEIGNIYVFQQKYDEAIHYYKKALKAFEGNSSQKFRIYNNLAYIYAKQKDSLALHYSFLSQEETKRIYKVQHSPEYSTAFQNIAVYYSLIGEHEKAKIYIDSAIFNNCYGLGVTGDPVDYTINYVFVDDKINLIEFLDEKADILRKSKDTILLERNFTEIDSSIQAIREERFDDQSRFFQQSKLSKYYIEAFRYFVSINNVEKSYAYAQKMKNIILLEKLHYQSSLKELPLKYRKEYIDLKDSLNVISERLIGRSSDEMFDKRRSLLLAISEFQNKIKLDFPNYHQKRFDRQDIPLSTLKDLLLNNQVILDYFVDSTSLYVFAISNKGIRIEIERVDSLFLEKLEYVSQSISTRPEIMKWTVAANDELNEYLLQLSRDLIPSFTFQFADFIIIPHDQLFNLPFEALITDKSTSCPYFVCEKNVSYSFSSQLWATSKLKGTPSEIKAFIYSPYEKDSSQVHYLKYAREESSVIDRVLGAPVITDISKDSLLQMCSAANVHHFLSHTYIDVNKPKNSYLSLGENQEPIKIFDIISQDINSEMVCLSACETGSGNYIRGEGVISLARGFLEAGAKSVVMSSYKVSDKSSAKLMSSFYENLKEGMNKSEALSSAKRQYLSRSSGFESHPFFWAGFTIQGKENAIFQSMKTVYIWSTVLAVLLVIIVFLFFLRRKKNREKY